MGTFLSIGTFVSPLKMEKLQFLEQKIQKSIQLHHTFCGPFKSHYKHIGSFEI